MLVKRVLTAAVLVPLMLAGIFFLDEFQFRFFIGAVALLGMFEWANIAGFSSLVHRLLMVTGLAVLFVLIHIFVSVTDQQWFLLILLSVTWWFLAAGFVIFYPSHSRWLNFRPVLLLLCIPILTGFWMSAIWLKSQQDALELLIWLMLLVWGADIGAYFTGRLWGKRKLAPSISPGKTWAGVYGGLAMSIPISVVMSQVFLHHTTLIHWVWLLSFSLMVVAISVVGDLFESVLKRNRGIKDSSKLLPGHGGVLDRIDSLCAAAPMFVLFWYLRPVI